MTARWAVRAAELTEAFSPQRKCETVWFKSRPRNHCFQKVSCSRLKLRLIYAIVLTMSTMNLRKSDETENREFYGRILKNTMQSIQNGGER